jgi:tetratricopeptide (TPR) repeat protein
MRGELARGDWEGLYQTASEWLQRDPNQPVATFVQNIACLFINPPSMIRNKRYLQTVGNKDWKAVLDWFEGFQTESDRHNPYFQALSFILEPRSKKKASIESALQDNPNNGELLFLQAISIQDRELSIGKLKQAVENKPEFPAAYYLLGIFSLELNQAEAAQSFLKQAASQAPDFLEAHYQLGSLYSLYVEDGKDQATQQFQKVIELDPEGGAGFDAKKVLETGSQPQYGQRVGSIAGRQRSGMSTLAIVLISLLTTLLFSGPIASLLKITSPLVGILAGVLVFIGLYSTWGRKK